jgi:acyl-CoA thioesterase-1
MTGLPTSMLKILSFLLILLSAASSQAANRTILVYGDSLSAGFGIPLAQSWPALLDQRVRSSGWSVANASISGETTAGGRSRFAAALQQFKPDIVILALGANDGLRGLPVSNMQSNLQSMITAAKAQNARVMLAGIRLPPNYGPDYTREFESSYSSLAKREKLPFLPFLLEPIAEDRTAFQTDNLHPVASAQPKILDHVWGTLKPMLGAKK